MAKKILAMFLALCMCVSILPVQARAEENTETTTEATVTTENGEGGNATIVVTIDKPAEGTTGETGNADVSTASAEGETPATPVDGTVTETNITEDGLTEVTTTTTTTTTAENGDTTVTVTTETATDGTTEEGVTVDRDETYTEKTETVTDAEGTETSTSWIEDGTETKEWTEEVTPEDTDLPEVELELVPGETTTETVTETETIVSGDVPTGEDDTEYDYTETTTTTERTVEASASEGEVKVEVTGGSEMTSLQSDKTVTDGGLADEQLNSRYSYSGGFNDAEETTAPEGFDYRHTGFSQMSNFAAGVKKTDEEGNTISTGQTGALQFVLEYDPEYDPNSDENKEITAEDIFLAYCCDLTTDALDNYWYRIDELEDAGYYDEEAASYIRAIATNGYWGTAEGTGSLSKLKDDMKAALAAGTISGITEEEIDAITQGQALNATQGAIWKYANATTDGTHIDENRILGDGGKSWATAPTAQETKQAKAVFDYLLSLAPIGAEQGTEIIDQDSYIKEDSMSITIGDKLSGFEENSDDDSDNDIYDVALNFALVVTPSQDSDDLVVQVISGADATGKPIIIAQGRIAGGDAEEDAKNGFHSVVYDAETGVYTLKNLALAENSDFNFDLKLVGTQYLEQGVYLFTSETRGTTTSQTFVTVMEGDKEVNVSQSFTIEFEVDEEKSVEVKRVWHSEGDPVTEYTPAAPTEPSEPVEAANYEDDAPRVYRLNNGGNNVETIPDEEVPLAENAITGDESGILIAMVTIAAFGLIVMFFNDKKRKAEEI